MPRFPFAHHAHLLPEQWQRDRYARLAFRNLTTDAEQLFARVGGAKLMRHQDR